VADHLQRARAFVYAGEEDFGIAPVEALACGTPVIALGRGGLLETVIEGETGTFFPECTPEAIAAAVGRFEAIAGGMRAQRCRSRALEFSAARFEREFAEFARQGLARFRAGGAQ
jgi:glycosyltransferase involved in cell wall biosynthesis